MTYRGIRANVGCAGQLPAIEAEIPELWGMVEKLSEEEKPGQGGSRDIAGTAQGFVLGETKAKRFDMNGCGPGQSAVCGTVTQQQANAGSGN